MDIAGRNGGLLSKRSRVRQITMLGYTVQAIKALDARVRALESRN